MATLGSRSRCCQCGRSASGRLERVVGAWKRVAAVGILFACIGLVKTTALRAEDSGTTTIKLSFVLLNDFLAPTATPGHHSAYSAELVLSGNQIRERWESQSVGGTNSNYHADNTRVGGRWRVLSPNTIQASWPLVTYDKIVTVHVSGKTCTVNFDTQLHPGQTEYQFRNKGTLWTTTKYRMIASTCNIQ